MKILITAFEPFDNNEINYSKETLKRLTEHDNLIKEILPVEYFGSFEKLKSLINKHNPNLIILMGEARSYKTLGYEVIGINEHSNKPDNKNFIPTTKKIIDNDIDGLFSTLDYNLFTIALEETKTSFFRSFTAGTYVCNALLYQSLLYIKLNNLNIKCGFIHVSKEENQKLDDVVKGLNNYINYLSK